MFIIISIGMILTGIMFLIKAARTNPPNDIPENITPATRRIIDLRFREKKGLRNMGLLSLLLGAALLAVSIIYPVN